METQRRRLAALEARLRHSALEPRAEDWRADADVMLDSSERMFRTLDSDLAYRAPPAVGEAREFFDPGCGGGIGAAGGDFAAQVRLLEERVAHSGVSMGSPNFAG